MMEQITILYFGQLREQLGIERQLYALNRPCSVIELWQELHPNRSFGGRTLIAINHEYVKQDALVHAGDEVAFFPPVTGG
jgi:sulfur-carrier protein